MIPQFTSLDVLFQAAEKHVTAEETVQQLQIQLQDLQAELNRVKICHKQCFLLSSSHVGSQFKPVHLGEGLPHKNGVGSCWKILKTTLKGTRIPFCGCGPK